MTVQERDTFEERLLRELLAESDAMPAATPARRWRRTSRPLLLAGAATALAVGLAALPQALPGGGAPGGGDRLSRLLTAEPASAAEIGKRARAALAGARDVILHARQVTPVADGDGSVKSEMWLDQGSTATRFLEFDETGAAVLDSGFREAPAGERWWSESRQVDLAARTYTEQTVDSRPPGKRAAGRNGGEADRLRRDLAAGELRIAGHEPVGGRPAVVLTSRSEPELKRRIWVDEETYLPLKMTVTLPGGDVSTLVYDWLPRTADNLAELWPAVPDGVRKVAPPPVDKAKLRVKELSPRG